MSNQSEILSVQEHKLTARRGAVIGARRTLEQQVLEPSIRHTGIRVTQVGLEQGFVRPQY